MKKVLFCASLSLLSLSCFADATLNPPASPFNSNTTSIAKSTVNMAHDTAITTYIYAKMASHPNLANSNIDISTQDGTVILNGIVHNDAQAQEITDLAQSTSGVKSVDASKLIINPHDSTIYIKTAAADATPEVVDNANHVETAPIQPLAEKNELTEKNEAVQQELAQEATEQQPITTKELGPQQLALNHAPQTQAADQSQMLLADQDTAATPKAAVPAVQMKKNANAKVHLSGNHHGKSKKHCKHKTKKSTPKKAKHKAAPQKKVSAHHHSKTKAKALAANIKKHYHQQVLSQKKAKPQAQVASKAPLTKSTDSVDQMTNDYLKSALMANKPIPEE